MVCESFMHSLDMNETAWNPVFKKERAVVNVDKLVPKQRLLENIQQRIRDIITLMIALLTDWSVKKLPVKSRNVIVDITWRKICSKVQFTKLHTWDM